MKNLKKSKSEPTIQRDISSAGERNKTILNKRGSYTIFLTILLSGILIFTGACIKASGDSAIESTLNLFKKAWGKSILAEYDVELKERYGLFAFYADHKEIVEDKLDTYVEYSTDSKKYLKYESSECCLDGYSLGDPNNFVKQINEVMIYRTKPKINYMDDADRTNRRIINKWIINGLPSNSIDIKLDKSLLNTVSLYDYLFVYFKDYIEDRDLGRTYFRNEIEYVITGKLDDDQARRNVYYQILALRNAINLSYLYSSSSKRAEVMALAALFGPELAPILEVAFMEAWALAEAENDMDLLYEGKKVASVKDDRTWATSLWNAVLGYGSSGAVDVGVDDGLDYDDYLRVLLLKTSSEKIAYRVMDLIQINMKYNYCDYFLIKDYNVGVDFKIKINGNIYEETERYSKE